MPDERPENFTVTAKSRNIHVVNWAAPNPAKWEGWVLLRGDAHHDNPHSDHAMERKHLMECADRDGLWLDVGDLFCAMGGKWDPRGAKHGTTRPEHAMANDYTDSLVRHAADFYSPWADRCVVLGRGNHEQSILKRHETDLTERLAQSMRDRTGQAVTAGGYGGWVKFVLWSGKHSRCCFDLKYFHGSGGGGIMSFDTLRVRRQASYLPDADVIVCGHVHEAWHLAIGRERLRSQNGDYRVELDEQHHVRTGTYKDEYGDGYSGYHVEKGGPPKAIGAVWMRIRLGSTKGKDYARPVIDFMQAR
jgi:hypothetical protein